VKALVFFRVQLRLPKAYISAVIMDHSNDFFRLGKTAGRMF